MFFNKHKNNKASKTYEKQLNELMLKANNSRDKALVGIALQSRRLADKLYDIADPLKGYTKNDPERVLEYLFDVERELDSFLESINRRS